LYQIDDLSPMVTSPTTEAEGATKAEAERVGCLPACGTRVRWVGTGMVEEVEVEEEEVEEVEFFFSFVLVSFPSILISRFAVPRVFSPLLGLCFFQFSFRAIDLDCFYALKVKKRAKARLLDAERVEQQEKEFENRPSSSSALAAAAARFSNFQSLTSLRRRELALDRRAHGVDAAAEPPQGRAQQAQGRGGRLGGHF